MQPLAELPRIWAGTYLPGYHDWGDAFPLAPTYAGFPLDWLPPVERELDDELRWLLREPPVDESLKGRATRADLDALLAGAAIAFRRRLRRSSNQPMRGSGSARPQTATSNFPLPSLASAKAG